MATGTGIAPTAPTAPYYDDVGRVANIRSLGRAVMLAGSADPTTSYAAAGTSNYLDCGKAASASLLIRKSAGTDPTTIVFKLFWNDDPALTDAPVDYREMKASDTAGARALVVQEQTITFVTSEAYIVPVPVLARWLKIALKRSGGDTDTRIEVRAQLLSHTT